jgi:uncharacterized membrane protein YedE/YeeE
MQPTLRKPSPRRPGPPAAPAPVAVATGADRRDTRLPGLLIYLLLGTFFGIVLVKSEAVSWFRIQEMFRFQSFHMYGIIGSAVAVAALSLQVIRRLGVKDLHGAPLGVEPKEFDRGINQAVGGVLFGLGWALLGACPGPVYALIGSGLGVMAVALVSALAGVWVYGHLRPYLPR